MRLARCPTLDNRHVKLERSTLTESQNIAHSALLPGTHGDYFTRLRPYRDGKDGAQKPLPSGGKPKKLMQLYRDFGNCQSYSFLLKLTEGFFRGVWSLVEDILQLVLVQAITADGS